MIKCGSAELVITPSLGLMIPGQFAVKLAAGIKDDLYAKAIVFDDGENKIAMVVLDVIGISEAMTAKIRKRINESTAIPEKNIMISATHTHTGAPTDMKLYSSLPDEDTIKHLCYKAADAAILAHKNMKEVNIGYGVGYEYDVGFNRRFIMKDGKAATNPGVNNPNIVKHAAPVDASVNVIRVDYECGKPLAVMVNYACHLDVVGGFEYSADYPSEMSKIIKNALGNDVVVLFFNGCCGDINHIDFTGNHKVEPKEHYKKMGRILAGDVIAIREKISYLSEVKVNADNKIITCSRRQPTKEQVSESIELLKSDISVVQKTYAEAYIKLSNNPILTRDIEIQALKIGDVGITAYPSETFTEIGLAIKESSPFKNNFTIELANGCCGYVSTKKALDEGGYETKLSEYTYMGEETADEIINTSVDLLKSL